MVIVESVNVGNVIQFILKECNKLSDTVCVFHSKKWAKILQFDPNMLV